MERIINFVVKILKMIMAFLVIPNNTGQFLCFGFGAISVDKFFCVLLLAMNNVNIIIQTRKLHGVNSLALAALQSNLESLQQSLHHIKSNA